MAEHWRPVVGLEGRYEVSDAGRVRSTSRPVRRGSGVWIKPARILRPGQSIHGRLFVNLPNEKGGYKPHYIHTMVLNAFVGPCPAGMEGCHNDGDRQNNRLGNLRWDTHSANVRDTIRHGRHNYASRDRCSRGHELTEENTYTSRPNTRDCKTCAKDRARKSYACRIGRTAS